MARTAYGTYSVLFDPNAGGAGTQARWSNPAGAAADISVTLTHNLNALFPIDPAYVPGHALSIEWIALSGYTGAQTGPLGTKITGSTANTITIQVLGVPANTDVDGLLRVKLVHSAEM